MIALLDQFRIDLTTKPNAHLFAHPSEHSGPGCLIGQVVCAGQVNLLLLLLLLLPGHQ
jgi:hypothetical protein